MDNAKKFLARAVPWPTADDNWWISVHTSWRRGDRKGIGFGLAFKELEQAAWWIEHVWRDKTDVYVCMSGIGVVEQKLSKKGRPFHVAARHAENAMALRSLWLDVDVKPGGFRSTQEALRAVMAFVKASGMPPPTFIVMSGSGGFHLHWVLYEVVSRETWLPLAQALVAATQHFLLTPLDTAVTVNPVCLLRVPDTRNWKTDPPKPVWLGASGRMVELEKIQAVLAPFMGGIKAIKNQPLLPGQSILGPAFPVKPPLADFDKRKAYPELFSRTIDDVAVNCKFIADTLETHGEGLNEPVWFESLKVAYYTKDPDESIHRLSSGHPSYDQGKETDRKLAYIEKVRQRRDLGWPQCSTIHTAGAVQCGECPHRDKGQSPLNFVGFTHIAPTGNGVTAHADAPPPAVVAKSWFLPLPQGFSENHQHYVSYAEESEANEIKLMPVAGLPMWNFWLQEPVDGHGVYALNFTAGLNARTEKEIHLPYSKTGDRRSMFTYLNEQGFHVDPDNKYFGKIVTAFINMLRSAGHSPLLCEKLGWSYENGKRTAFVYSKTRFNCAGNTPVFHAHAAANDEFAQAGTLEAWKQAAKLITSQKIPALDVIIAASFAAPLVEPAGYNGMMLSAYSLESGVSKSAAITVAQAVWSIPIPPSLIDTAIYVNERLGMLRHLPMFYDELRIQSQTKEFVNLMFAMGQGKTRGRSSRSGAPQPVSTFSTLTIVASNGGVSDYIAKHTGMTTAGIHRLFEFAVPKNTDKTGMIDGATAQQIVNNLKQNYGHPGLIFAQYLGQHATEIEAIMGAVNKGLMQRLDAHQEERFWVGTIAVLIMGARYANKLGLTEIDEPAMTKFLIEQFHLLRKARQTSVTDVTNRGTITDHLHRYVNERRQQMIVSGTVWTQASRPPANYSDTVTDISKLQGRIAVRAATKDKILRVSKSDFTDWLEKQNLQPRLIFERMLKQLPVRMTKGSLGHGTIINTARETLFEFDLKKMDLFDF